MNQANSNLVLVDIDGVINAFPSTPDDRAHWPEDTWRTDHVYDPDVGYAFALHWSTAVVDRLRAIASLPNVEMKWCTTWQRNATGEFAPLVGLGTDWGVVSQASPSTPATGLWLDWWKADAAARTLDGYERVVWIDDDIDAWVSTGKMTGRHDLLQWMDTERLLTVCPKTTRALEPHHLDEIEGFLT